MIGERISHARSPAYFDACRLRVFLATLCLNEQEWIPRLYAQHREWPGLVGWCFVEAADLMYAVSSPHRVSDEGLSVDGTTDVLRTIAAEDLVVTHVRHGFAKHGADLAQGKCSARNRYLRVADEVRPDVVVVLDADEFYSHMDQVKVNQTVLRFAEMSYQSFVFRQRQIWRPASIRDQPLLRHEVRGGFWDIPHCRAWTWERGMRYQTNHNTPVGAKGPRDRHRLVENATQCVHLGWAASLPDRAAKNRYYETRGESSDPKRQWYTESRAAWETWTPRRPNLPRGATVVPYDGPIPECFQGEK